MDFINESLFEKYNISPTTILSEAKVSYCKVNKKYSKYENEITEINVQYLKDKKGNIIIDNKTYDPNSISIGFFSAEYLFFLQHELFTPHTESKDPFLINHKILLISFRKLQSDLSLINLKDFKTKLKYFCMNETNWLSFTYSIYLENKTVRKTIVEFISCLLEELTIEFFLSTEIIEKNIVISFFDLIWSSSKYIEWDINSFWENILYSIFDIKKWADKKYKYTNNINNKFVIISNIKKSISFIKELNNNEDTDFTNFLNLDKNYEILLFVSNAGISWYIKHLELLQNVEFSSYYEHVDENSHRLVIKNDKRRNIYLWVSHLISANPSKLVKDFFSKRFIKYIEEDFYKDMNFIKENSLKAYSHKLNFSDYTNPAFIDDFISKYYWLIFTLPTEFSENQFNQIRFCAFDKLNSVLPFQKKTTRIYENQRIREYVYVLLDVYRDYWFDTRKMRVDQCIKDFKYKSNGKGMSNSSKYIDKYHKLFNRPLSIHGEEAWLKSAKLIDIIDSKRKNTGIAKKDYTGIYVSIFFAIIFVTFILSFLR